MKIRDPFGNVKDYDPEKIIDSVQRAGFTAQRAEQIETRVRDRVEGTIRSKELYRIVFEEMKARDEAFAYRYKLREAIGALNPQYAEFEKYMTRVLAMDGFETEHSPRPLPQGECSEHEVDVVAKDGQTTWAVECKHHFHYHRITGMDVAMVQFAAVEDLCKGYEQGLDDSIDIEKGWVIVNTKLSNHAMNYAQCKGIRMTAWDSPDGDSLREMVERHRAYPITILPIDRSIRVALSKNDILTIQDLIHLDDHQVSNVPTADQQVTRAQELARELLHDSTDV